MAEQQPLTDQSLWDLKSFPAKIKDDEDIIMITRQDIVILFTRGLLLFLVFFGMLVARTFAGGLLGDIGMGIFDTAFYGITILLLMVFTLYFHNYYLSLQVITNERVIDIDQKGVFNREVNELSLGQIEDVSFKQQGFWGTIFNYGNVILQTAGTGSNAGGNLEDKINGFVFNNVPNPTGVCHIISTMFQKEELADFEEAAAANAEALRDVFEKRK